MVRLLFIGSLSDKPDAAIRKLNSLNQKSGPFAFAILLSPPLHSDLPTLPIPTYFAAQEYAGSDIPRLLSDNLHYVGAASSMRLYGLNAVLLSDGYDDAPSSAPLPAEVAVAVKSAGMHGAAFRGVDILATAVPLANGAQGCRLAARLGWMLHPRYHAVPGRSDGFKLTDPFVIKDAQHGSRLVAVPGFMRGKRWVYALDARALDCMSDRERAGTKGSICAAVPYDEAESGLEHKYDQGDGGRVGKMKRQRTMPDTEAACWFCLSNGKDKHLVLHVGKYAYIALAKGGLSMAHVLIVPVEHVHGSGDSRLSDAAWAEMMGYMEAVKCYFGKELNGCVPYFFERCVKTSGGEKQMHMHVQAIPLRREVVGRAGEVFDEVAQRFGIVVREIEDLNEVRVSGEGMKEMFWAKLPGGRMFLSTGMNKGKVERRLPLHFGRLIAATLLGQAQRYDWKVCIESGTREVARAARVQSQLLSYVSDNK